MFENIPIFAGKSYNYHQYFSLISMLFFLGLFLVFGLLYFIFKKLEDYLTMRKLLSNLNKNERINNNLQPILPKSELSSDKFKLVGRHKEISNKEAYQNEGQKQEFFGSSNYQRSKLVKTLFWLKYIMSLFCVICVSFCPICWSAFGKLPIPAAIFILLLIYYARFISDVIEFRPNSVKQLKNRDNENYFLFKIKLFARINIVTCRRYKVFYIGANILIIFFSIFLPFLFENSCITFHNPSIGIKLGSADLSTKITRHSSDYKCPVGPPCHIYATLPENSTNAVFLNFHTNTQHKNVQVFNDSLSYYSVQKVLRYQVNVKRFDPELEPVGSRYVYSALITGLNENSSYAFGVFYDGTYQKIKFYYTMPEQIEGNDSVVFANGGDVGNSETVMALANSLIMQMPNVIFFGGDIAYDNGLTSCYHSWDGVLSMIDGISISLNRLIPVILAVGNHDVGLNSLSGTNISLTTSSTPLFFQYFPQHFAQDYNGKALLEIPEIHERRTYFYHKFAGAIFFTLDSGYMNTFKGYQSRWLNKSLSLNNDLIKFVQYHNPSFPACNLDSIYDKTPNVHALLFWSNLFDKYNVTTVFENHSHLLKRTKKLKGNLENVNGTVYLGDGAWGDVHEKCGVNNDEEFFENIEKNQHVWVSRLGSERVNYSAIGVNGKVFDSDSQKIYR